jgi:hypothetical protein
MRNVPHTGSYNICGTTPRIITCNQDGRPGLLGRIVLPRNGRDRLDLDQQLGLAQSVHLDDRAGGRAVREQLLAQRAGASCARLGSDPDSWHDDAGDTLRPQRGCRDCLPGPGRGAFDVVFIPGSISHVEVYWGAAGVAALLRGVAADARVLVFDKRGTGMSDRVAQVPTLEERSDDIRAVMDAAE